LGYDFLCFFDENVDLSKACAKYIAYAICFCMFFADLHVSFIFDHQKAKDFHP